MKYIIQEIGWMYNDSTYDNDGNYRVIRILDSKEDADELRKNLNYDLFVNHFSSLNRFEAYGDYKNSKNYRDRINKHLVEKLNFNPTIQLKGYLEYSIFLFLELPTIDEVNALLEEMNITFFSITEIENNSQIQFEAKVNPCYNNITFDDSFWNYHGTKILRFTTKQEAFKRLIDRDDYWYPILSGQHPKLKGTLEQLTDLPTLLKSLINTCKHLTYDNHQLAVTKDIDPTILMQVSELLKDPILLFEEVNIENAQETFDNYIISVRNMNKRDVRMLSERNSRYSSTSKLLNSREYLLHYAFRLNMNVNHYNYRKIIENYFQINTGEGLVEKFRNVYYKESMVQLFGVIKSLKKKEEEFIVEGCFGCNRHPIIDENYTSIGTGQNLESAFEDSLKNWLKVYGDEFIAALGS